MTRSHSRTAHARYALLFIMLSTAACADQRLVAPDELQVSLAKASNNPTVKSAVPDSAPRSVTLNVQVSGSGFDAGSRAVWALSGDTAYATTKIKTNSTTYVSASSLVANITIAGDAPLAKFDVQVVTTNGRKGIGIELFAVIIQMTDLGTLPNASPSFANAINVDGTIVGYSYTGFNYSGVQHAVRWNRLFDTWTIEDLSPLLGNPSSSQARAINSGGDIVGTMNIAPTVSVAFLLTASGALTDLGALTGRLYSEARDINASGEVVGDSNNPNELTHAFFWSASGGLESLPALGGISSLGTTARAINDNAIIVGMSRDSDGLNYAVSWLKVNGSWTVNKLPSGVSSSAVGINNRGDIVGFHCLAGVSPCKRRALYWAAGQAPLELGTLGGAESSATDVNDVGVVVGETYLRSGAQRGFVWTAAGGMKELLPLGSSKGYSSATSNNAGGLIAGFSRVDAGYSSLEGAHATLWPTPK